MQAFVLASQSPRRQELLRVMGITTFRIILPIGEEYSPDEMVPEERVKFLSQQKLFSIRSQLCEDEIAIAADTLVFLDSQVLGKPHDADEALQMLTLLSGRRHRVCTGVSVLQGEKCESFSVSTDVYFRESSVEERLHYIESGEPMDKAGAYGVQGKGALLIDRIDGDFFNVMGLPIAKLAQVLCRFGVQIL